MLAELRRALDADGYVVVTAAVGDDAVDRALRRLNMTLRQHGITPGQIEEWSDGTFFPHLRWEPEVWGVLPAFAAELFGWREGDDWADPQLLLRFPDESQQWPVEPHVDRLPDWASDTAYRGIVGVALTPAGERDGAPCVWPGSHRGEAAESVALALRPGDALFMHPQLGHSGRLNLGPTVRTAVYFRLLAGVQRPRPGKQARSYLSPARLSR
jgi:ectoine hydroxylase-related dioxygenase (phytanoyl-CoA dioxygenase family)